MSQIMNLSSSFRPARAALVAAFLGLGCGRGPGPGAAAKPDAELAAKPDAEPDAELAAKPEAKPDAELAAKPEAKPGALAWIEDDPTRAFALAKASGRPIFVDTWATWCHSCLALKAEVLTDPRLSRLADRFVWLSLDVEKPGAASFLARFPQPAYPTLWVLDKDGAAVLRWVGTLTAVQLEELLDDALVAVSGEAVAELMKAMLKAEAAAAEGRSDDAIAAYRETLALAPADWPRRSRTANALMFVLSKAERAEDALALALAEVPKTRPGMAGRPDLVIGGIDAAVSLGDTKDDPAKAAARKAALESLLAVAKTLVDDPSLLGDDRSGVWMGIVDALDALGDEAAKKAASEAWATFLDTIAGQARSPEQRAVFDSHRMSALLAVGRAEDALEMMDQSERDFPNDYNPPARKANILLQMGRLDDALASVRRALELAYGPRRLRVRMTEVAILEKQGDSAGVKAALAAALDEGKALPEAQRPAKLIAEIEKKIVTARP